MEAVLVIGILAAVVWGLVFLQRCSLLAATIATVVGGYVLTNHFWRLSLGPVSINAGRVLVAGLIVLVVWRWWQGTIRLRPLTGVDWFVFLFVGYVAARFLTTSYPTGLEPNVDPLWRLIECFCVPLALYLVARSVEFGERSWNLLLLALSGLGTYLAITGLAEVTSQWWAVFPRYIADPTLGTHFGRARGPALNSVSLGIYLNVCFWATWLLWSRVARPYRLLLLGSMGLMAVATYFTYTRSAWLALAFTLAVLPVLHAPRTWKPLLVSLLLVTGLFGTAVLGGKLINLNRQDADASASHSVYQRQSFLLVSLRMVAEDPLLGCGFGRFFDKKLPYLADRSQQIELESIRQLDHHNTYLSILTETGAIGLTLLLAMLAALVLAACRMFRTQDCPAWIREQGLLMLALLAAYSINGVFHDLSLLAGEQWLLLFVAGAGVGWFAEWRVQGSELRVQSQDTNQQRVTNSPSRDLTDRRLTPEIQLFGIKIDRLDMRGAVEKIWQWREQGQQALCRYVVTPNVDHVVMYQANEALRSAYAGASMVLADGAPVVLASKLLGKSLPERVAGSDLVPALFDRAAAAPKSSPLRVFLLGAGPGVADRAAEKIHRRWKNVEVVGTYCPPLGFENDPQQNRQIIAAVAATKADVLLIGLGAPKQELWVRRHAHRLQVPVALCIGATIDFLAGEKRRSPQWMREAGLEWLHRLASEPRRLLKRYSHDAWVFPQLMWQELTA